MNEVEPASQATPSRLPPPTYLQSLVASVGLLALSLLCLPGTFGITLIAFIWTHLNGTSLKSSTPLPGVTQKTVLVTGARSNKALALMRALKRAGHRVIAAEEREWGVLACARFSRAVDKYFILPDAPPDDHVQTTFNPYIDVIKYIVVTERVDAWIPCSSVHGTILDSEAAREIKEGGWGGSGKGRSCDVFIQHPDIAGALHWKDRFTDLLVQLGFPVPEGRCITNIAQALDFLHAPDRASHAYILKCLTLDDLARDDFTLLPLGSREETLAHLKKMPTPMSNYIPFMLQRFLKGPEYCCHVAARNGEITAFVACRSSEMLMRYVDVNTLDAKEAKMGKMIEQWVADFLERWKVKLVGKGPRSYERELTGHFSFDFIWEEEEEVLYAIECNVRAHTAICLFSTATPELAESYLVTTSPPFSRPPPQSVPVSWITHALPLAVLHTFLRLPLVRMIPPHIWGSVHPGLTHLATELLDNHDPTASPRPSDTPLSILTRFLIGTFLPEFILNIYRGVVAQTRTLDLEENLVRGTDAGFGRGERDAYWDWTDPVPFFVLAHVTWVWLWVRLVVGRGGKWRRVNVSTERIFEC
ncbi:hypothetical protein EUX98_g9360 [Antrodiella citrinella]|uniref:ATP-grasp domain-containing protein n=1 Tax=Antrodiella citrinella TaxID=2447956 RepID=A0A4V3XF41_9APHY|nr:hypothetical protein EUX98_g9360 [Antrodiella citrinella]